MKQTAAALLGFLLCAHTSHASAAELAYVGNGRLVDLEHFNCFDTSKSIFLRRVCYDEENSYLLVELNENWLHYCEVDRNVVARFKSAPSAATFYNSNIRSGPFDCRRKRLPEYN